jgi:peptidoglycan/LPS O-acetylase OafA/YrhL
VIPNLTMLQGGVGVKNVDPAFWTLWVELHFYAMIAILSAIGITYRSCVAFMGGWLFLGLYANEADHDLLQALLIPTWAPYFIGGMALFMIYRFGSTLLLWGFVAVSWLLSLHYSAWRAGKVFKDVSDPLVVVAVTGLFAVMILVTLHRLSWLRWSGLTVLGALTYPVYLIHQQIAWPLLDRIYPALDRWAALAVLTAVCLGLSYLIHRFVERPVAAWMKPRLRESLARMRMADSPAVTAPVPGLRAAGNGSTEAAVVTSTTTSATSVTNGGTGGTDHGPESDTERRLLPR